MKKIISVIVLLSCIASSMFALSAKIIPVATLHDYRSIIVYDDNGTKVLEYERPRVSAFSKRPLGSLYAITWYKEGATVEQIKEWKEFAKLFVEEEE